MKNNLLSKLTIVVTFMAFLSACSSRYQVQTPDVYTYTIITEHIEVGNHVIIKTKDGKDYDFVIREMNEQQLIGKKDTVEIANIDTLERKDVDLAETGGVVLGVLGALLAVQLWMVNVSTR